MMAPTLGDTSVCRTCNCPITFKVVDRGDRYLPITTWSDGWRVDEHICFKAVNYQHEPPRGVCRRCGCTEEKPCTDGCSWVHPDLCSACHDSPSTRLLRTESATHPEGDHLMPEIRHYTVIETTAVRVSAISEAEALEKAELRFINPTPRGDGTTPKRIETKIRRDS